jgi:hypothetical protein
MGEYDAWGPFKALIGEVTSTDSNQMHRVG